MYSLKRLLSIPNSENFLQVIKLWIGVRITLQEFDVCIQTCDGVLHSFYFFHGLPPGDLQTHTHANPHLHSTKKLPIICSVFCKINSTGIPIRLLCCNNIKNTYPPWTTSYQLGLLLWSHCNSLMH